MTNRFLLASTLIGLAGALVLMLSTPLRAAPAPCLAKKAWFPHDQTKRPNDGANFVINCDFHQWSWQMFLWLTQVTGPNGKLRFETMPNFADVKALADGGSNDSPPPDGSLRFDLFEQAGSEELLIDQNGHSVYYSMYVNERFFEFIKKNGYANPAKFYAAPADQSWPLKYGVGALEVKASWKIVPADEDTDGMYTRSAQVRRLIEKDGHIVVDPRPDNKYDDVTVALVGFHIAGRVNGHPEAIWATFEHRANAPDLQPGPNANIPIALDKVVSETDFTFFAGGSTASQCNADNSATIRLVDPKNQIFAPITQACRQYPHGGGTYQNVDNINSLNDSVHSKLAADQIWQNYDEVGAIWFAANNGLVPNSQAQDVLTGSIVLSNSTIETYTQIDISSNNCFQCHNTLMRFTKKPNSLPLPGKNLSISHILVNIYTDNPVPAGN